MREALTQIAALYGEHGVLLRAIVEVSTYDEEVAQFWRGLLGALRRRDRAPHRDRGRARPAPRTRRVRPGWMTERTFYQQLVQAEPFLAADLVDALVGIYRAVYGWRLCARST